MIIINPTVKYGSTYYNTFTMEVCCNYHGYFFQCNLNRLEKKTNIIFLAQFPLELIE